jgi:hypothetical protein
MADTVINQVLENGPKNLVTRHVSFSDGTGESAVAKVDATSATYAYKGVSPGIYLGLKKIQYNVRNGGVRLQWDCTTDEDILTLTGADTLIFDPCLRTPASAGATGSILFTTVGFMINSSYSIVLTMFKSVPQS